ncbi:uncharacterized protein JCM10292_001391 [Rhodotorula paludigena]|uniref:uncharacterized protein n=1 Tax=Rhodotorula paludigena TaxID=86838 RepID=UPI0031705286
MLESVRSRRVYGASLVIVLPLAGALGYYLRTRHDDDVSSSASAILASTSPSSSSSIPPPPPRKLTPAEEVALLKEQAAVEERVRMLRRKEGVLADEAKELRDKLERVRNRGHAV